MGLVELAQEEGKGRGLAVDRARGMPTSKGQQGSVPAMVVLVSTFTVSCGEVWSCSSVAAFLALSPTHGSLSSEQENETGSPE